MESEIKINELISSCIDLATQAGEVIRVVRNSGNLDVKEKGVDDPMTQADLFAQETIVGGLLNRWPSLKIIGEEDAMVAKKASTLTPRSNLVPESAIPDNLKKISLDRVVVFIDPLDATKEFTLGFYYCVITLIGISIDGKPAAGIMYQPFVDNGRLIWGVVGGPLEGVSRVAPRTDNRLILTTTASHNSAAVDNAIAKIKPDEVIRVGGAGYKVLLLLEGKADAYVFPTKGTKLWDTCAPEAVLRSAGGRLTDTNGKDIEYHHNSEVQNLIGFIATLHANHDKLLNQLHS